MLHEFLTENRAELIKRCRSKARKRDSPVVTSFELEHGVPLFLAQLVEALHNDEASAGPVHGGIARSSVVTSAAVENSRTAALHGKELLKKGFTLEQVVHGYGDVCQSITELAKERNAPITVDEFHTFNRLLDGAIADAVSSYGRSRDASHDSQGAQDLHNQIGTLADELRVHVSTALKALDALKVGNIGLMGTTGSLLEDSLVKLRELIDKSLPEIRLSTGMTTSR
jgi:hypothetical protein